MGVSPTGILFACQEHSTYTEGDIFKIGDVYSGINKDKHFALIKKYIDGFNAPMAERHERCKNCLLSNHCYSDNCPSTSYREYSDFGFGSEIWCWWNQTLLAVARGMMLRMEMEQDVRLLEYLIEYLNLPLSVKDIIGRRDKDAML